mmetsp:Transcript_10308/g.32846  ORF Transcript_10308/g.32846 Transcript_10308/m.32846 type:complete len:240 (+) Transcript_10308:295-1014(+)
MLLLLSCPARTLSGGRSCSFSGPRPSGSRAWSPADMCEEPSESSPSVGLMPADAGSSVPASGLVASLSAPPSLVQLTSVVGALAKPASSGGGCSSTESSTTAAVVATAAAAATASAISAASFSRGCGLALRASSFAPDGVGESCGSSTPSFASEAAKMVAVSVGGTAPLSPADSAPSTASWLATDVRRRPRMAEGRRRPFEILARDKRAALYSSMSADVAEPANSLKAIAPLPAIAREI